MMHVILSEMFLWWYTTGWIRLVHKAGGQIQAILDFFSVSLLVDTLFDPFRQIDAGRVHGTPQQELRAFGNRLFSRIVGFFVRSFTIVLGGICALVAILVGLVELLVWPLLPFTPFLGLLAALMGWTL